MIPGRSLEDNPYRGMGQKTRLNRRLLLAFMLPLVGLVILTQLVVGAMAQGESFDWNEPERIWGYEDVAEPPFMVADRNRTVHAMNSRTSELGVFRTIDITYRRWTPSLGWSEPVDVILSPKKNIARIRGLMLDDKGYLHLVFYGGDEQDASIYYTTAPAIAAGRAPSWSEPALIGERAGPINDAAFAGDGQSRLFVVYTGNRAGFGAYSMYSLDGGLTWSENKLFHLSEQGQAPTHYSLLVDAEGRLHVVWSEADLLSGNGETLYYALLDENQQSWTQPTVLARRENNDFEVDTPALVEHDDRLILVYHDDFPTTRYMRQSTDGGTTWTEPQRLFEQVGSNGPATFAIDSDSNLHMFFGGRIDRSQTYGIWQTNYAEGNMTQPIPVVIGPLIRDEEGGNGFAPAFPKSIVIQGNTILLTWATDPIGGRNGVHYTYASVEVEQLPLLPLPTLAPTAAPIRATDSPLATPEPTRTPSPVSVSSSPAVGSSPMMPLLLGSASVLALVGLVVAGRAIRRKR